LTNILGIAFLPGLEKQTDPVEDWFTQFALMQTKIGVSLIA
jgi:hypothetical protein